MKINIDPKVKNILEWVYCIVIAVVLALLFRYYIGTPTVVSGSSMFGTLEEGERLLLNRWIKTTHGKYNRGDIITIEEPSNVTPSIFEVDLNNPVAEYNYKPKGFFAKFNYYVLEFTKTSFIKRVIGVEGDHIKIEDGKVYLNDKELEEPYLDEGVTTPGGTFSDVVVPKGYVFIMGDNREHSTDSRSFGCVPINKIESKVWIRFWPFNKFGKVD